MSRLIKVVVGSCHCPEGQREVFVNCQYVHIEPHEGDSTVLRLSRSDGVFPDKDCAAFHDWLYFVDMKYLDGEIGPVDGKCDECAIE